MRSLLVFAAAIVAADSLQVRPRGTTPGLRCSARIHEYTAITMQARSSVTSVAYAGGVSVG